MRLVHKFGIYSSRPTGIHLVVDINKSLLEGLPEDLVKKVVGEAIRQLEAFAVGRQRDPADLDYRVESE